MNLIDLKKGLEKSVKIHESAESRLKQQIAEELEVLNKLLAFLMPILPKETINSKQAVLIYVFENSTKKTISNRVYFCEDGKIRYQVFDKEKYRNFNPTIEYEGSYAVVPAEIMFKKIDLSDVVEFFEEEIETLPYIAEDIDEAREIRKGYLKKFSKVINKINYSDR